jgi:acetyl-CoA carboxylase carboxyl transferase subunit beta
MNIEKVKQQTTLNLQGPEANLLERFKIAVDFSERDGNLLISGLRGLIKLTPKGHETYEERLERERKKGHDEAASYGWASIDGKRFVLYATHKDFCYGTFGRVAGEKFVKAAELASEKGAPFVAFFTSAGARQHENYTALLQMPRMTAFASRFKRTTNAPYIAIVHDQVWGGISASAVPSADLTIAIEGTRYGFAGPQVIESAEGAKPPENSQTVEAAVKERRLDIVVSEGELLPLLREILNAVGTPSKKKFSNEDFRNLPFVPTLSESERFRFGLSIGEETVFPKYSQGEQGQEGAQRDDILVRPKTIDRANLDDLHERFQSLMSDYRRLDTEMILRQCFDSFVPLYNMQLRRQSIVYPAIIAGLGRLCSHTFLVVGNQPSYFTPNNKPGWVKKIAAYPTPEDMRYLRRMLKLGERLELPALFLTDSAGAKAAIGAERADVAREIQECIEAGMAYKGPTLSIVIGVLGSGGGLVTTPIADFNAMTEYAMAFVAEPVSATTILYSQANPDIARIKYTTETLRATARDQKELRLIDDVIAEPEGGGGTNPSQAADAIRKYLLEKMIDIQSWSKHKRLKRRFVKTRSLEGIPFKELENM